MAKTSLRITRKVNPGSLSSAAFVLINTYMVLTVWQALFFHLRIPTSFIPPNLMRHLL